MNVVLPVIHALQAEPGISVKVLALTTASAVLTRNGVPHLRFKDLVRPEDAAAIETGRRLAAKLDSALVDADEGVPAGLGARNEGLYRVYRACHERKHTRTLTNASLYRLTHTHILT